MQFLDLEPPYQTFVRTLLTRAGYDAETFHLAMGPGDEMFFKGVLPGYPGRPGAAFFRYVESALRTFDVYRQLADHLGGFEALGPVLDFGSGWGRLTRALRHHLPRERIWACDLYAEAIAWQAETFGVNGLVSVTDPANFALTQRHSIVFAASVFSHLPDGLFQAWLRRLHSLVAPNGLLAFSVHGTAFAPEGQAISETGIGFAGWSESATLDPASYGMSYVTPAYVAAAIREAIGPDVRHAAFPCALFENQDLYVVAGPEVSLEGLQVRAGPVGGFAKLGGPGEPWRGWGVDTNPGRQLERADLFIDEVHVATAAPTADNEPVRQFFRGTPNMPVRWSFDPVAADRDIMLRVDLASTSGKTTSCYALRPADLSLEAPRA